MPTIHHLINYFRSYGLKNRALFALSFMILFWCIFDGIIEFITPIVITQAGYSTTTMGLIISSSSLAGLILDFILCKILSNTNFRRLYLILFIICAIYPFVLLTSKILALFLIAMALWGLYYDLFCFGRFDFVGRFVKKEEHAQSSGIISVFVSLGYLLAPLIAGFLVIDEVIDFKTFAILWIVLAVSFLFYLLTVALTKNIKHKEEKNNIKNRPLLKELFLLKHLGWIIFPALLLTFMINLVDATFWTLGPIISESIPELGHLGGLFLTAYLLPSLFAGWFVGKLTLKLGKKKTAYISLLISSLLFASILLINNSYLLIAIVFIASFFISLASPAINGAYADYISEAPKVEKEIESLIDSATNLGFIIGPAFAGFLATGLGNLQTFSVMGMLGAVIAIILLIYSPKKIQVKVNKSEL